MQAGVFYYQIKRIMGNCTPLLVDCGGLCANACCQGDGDTGMYLFPKEVENVKQDPLLTVVDSAFFYSSESKTCQTKMALCNGRCNRPTRPLSCMIFPFFPYLNLYGELDVRLDVRGRGICPLIGSNDRTLLDETFISRVEYISKILVQNQEVFAFLFEISRLMDQEYVR